MKGYVPKVLVVGSVLEFRARLHANQAAEVIGNLAIERKSHKMLLDNQPIELQKLKDMSNTGVFDCIVFLDNIDYWRHAPYLQQQAIHPTRTMTIDYFESNFGDRFYSHANDEVLFRLLYQLKKHSLFDADSYFAEGQRYVKPHALSRLRIDGLQTQSAYPIRENFYDRIYASTADCRFRHYDMVLLTKERDVEELRAALEAMRDTADQFLVFARRASNAAKVLPKAVANGINGSWYLLQKIRAEDKLSIYVVTHKKHSLADLPGGYITIHAGRALGEDLGYLGDDTGDNISKLNPYLNELTALYWIWKNVRQEFVGIAHYRRFFSNQSRVEFDAKNILTGEQAREMLKEFDMLVGAEAMFPSNTQRGVMVFDAEYDEKLARKAVNLIKKMLERHQPEYVDSFEQIMNGQCLFPCSMMITRKYVFDAYCQWLFSFILPSLEEFKGELANVSVRRKRMLGFVAERMFGVWLLKNRLRLRELPIMVAP